MHFLIVSHSLGESECFNESIQLQKAVMEDAQGFIYILVMVWNKQLVCCQGTHSYTLGRLVLLSSSHQKLTVTWQNYSRISDFYQTSPCMINVCLRLYVYDLVFQFIFGGGRLPSAGIFVILFIRIIIIWKVFCNGCIWDPSFLYGF